MDTAFPTGVCLRSSDILHILCARPDHNRFQRYNDLSWAESSRMQVMYVPDVHTKYICSFAGQSSEQQSSALVEGWSIDQIDPPETTEFDSSITTLKGSIPRRRGMQRKGKGPEKQDLLAVDAVTEHNGGWKTESEVDKISLQLRDLGMEFPVLSKCLEHTAYVTEQQLLELIDSLKLFGISSADVGIMFTKDPTLVKVDKIQVQQLLELGVEQGLDSRAIGRMCMSWPGLLHQTRTHVRNVLEYLTTMGLSKEVLIKILTKRPQVLGLHLDRLQLILNCLVDAGIPVGDLPRLLTNAPELFALTTQENLSLKLAFLQNLGLTAGSLGKALARRPTIIKYSLEGMEGNIHYLQSMISPQDIPRLIRRYAEVLVLDPTKKMYPMISYLLRIGVKAKDLGKVLLRRPQLLGYTVQGLEPTIQYLIQLGIREDMLGKVITTAPQVLTSHVEEKLKPAVDFLQTMGLNRPRDMELLFMRNAQVLCCSIEKNLRPKFEYLMSMGLQQDDVATMIVSFPSMMGQSINGSLAPKFEYLVKGMERDVSEVVDFPQYFGYSLQNRIRPRHEKLVSKGVKTSLASMLACVDRDFEHRYLSGEPPTRAPYKARTKVSQLRG